MLSVQATLLKTQLRLIKPIFTNLSIETSRKGQDAYGALGAKLFGSKNEIAAVPTEGFESRMITPPECREDGAILYLHGGAYVAGGIDYALGYGNLLAQKNKCDVLCAAYRLAPENPFPAALDDAYAAYKYLLTLTDNIVLVGESAGGGLLLALTYKLILENERLPLCDVAISPWTDLTNSSPTYALNARRDPSLGKRSLNRWAKAYAGNDRENPLVSPYFCEADGFPPCLIIVGGDEILLGDSLSFYDKLRAAKRRTEIIVENGLWHGYPLYVLPEATRANERIAEFIAEHFDGKKD